LLRPLLDVSRGEIEAYARHVGLAWIDDESNGDTAITRNFLRHQTLVALGQRFPAAESALAQAASHFAEAGGCSMNWPSSTGSGWRRKCCTAGRFAPAVRAAGQEPAASSSAAPRLAGSRRQSPRRVRPASADSRPDRHPELVLPDGKMRVAQRRLHWLSGK
jgi:tRNA(Ile)-lysidine synthase